MIDLKTLIPVLSQSNYPLSSAITNVLSSINMNIQNSISIIYRINANNLANHELKIHRLLTLANEIKANPSLFYGQLFNGSLLPSTDAEVLVIVDTFISNYLTNIQQIENMLLTYKTLMTNVASSKTITELIGYIS